MCHSSQKCTQAAVLCSGVFVQAALHARPKHFAAKGMPAVAGGVNASMELNSFTKGMRPGINIGRVSGAGSWDESLRLWYPLGHPNNTPKASRGAADAPQGEQQQVNPTCPTCYHSRMSLFPEPRAAVGYTGFRYNASWHRLLSPFCPVDWQLVCLLPMEQLWRPQATDLLCLPCIGLTHGTCESPTQQVPSCE